MAHLDDKDHHDPTTAKKGKPTPKRKDREAERKRALVIDKKTDSRKRRAERSALYRKEQDAMRSGDERNMPMQFRGAENRFLRDFIDARTTIGEFLLPLSLIFVVLSLLLQSQAEIGSLVIITFYTIVLAAIVEAVVTARRLKKNLIAKFGESKLPRGWRFQMVSRNFQVRRFRTPRPKVGRGEYPV